MIPSRTVAFFSSKVMPTYTNKTKQLGQNIPKNNEKTLSFLSKIQQKYNLQSPEDWNSITTTHISSNGGWKLLKEHSIYELKCMACPEGKSIFKNPKQSPGYWENKDNILKFLLEIKEKYNLNTPEDWNSITHKHILSNGGGSLFTKYSIYDLKCMACPEGKLMFKNPRQTPGYWENKDNIDKFLLEIKEKYNLQSAEDWNLITAAHIQSNGGNTLLAKYSMFDLKCLACPEGKSIFSNAKQSPGYWKNKENVLKFLLKIKEKYNLQSAEDWNSITLKHIKSNGGSTLLAHHSLYELKCLANPNEKSFFKQSGYWEIKENLDNFLLELKRKYNLQNPEDWNSITHKHIQSIGGGALLKKLSIYELKCMACPEGKSIFNNPKQSPGYWDNNDNILKFLSEIQQIYNLKSPEDWNSVTTTQIKSNGGGTLLTKHSMYEVKCMACPEGKSLFKSKSRYWENRDNIDKFFLQMKEKYNLDTPEDWNRITHKHIQSNGGGTLLTKYSMFDLKCMACPEGKLIFTNPKQSPGYWEKTDNILKFLSEIQQIYNLKSPEDWNSITQNHIKSNGGSILLAKYSLHELKCLACPDGKLIFNKPNQSKSSEYWEDETNRNQFFLKLKNKYNLQTPSDWKRISQSQIIALGGNWIFSGKNDHLEIKIPFEDSNNGKMTKFIPLKELISDDSIGKRSSQRWLFLQIQKLFPNEEIVEDYFHSELSRKSGANIQFDIFMIERNIAMEYHGKHHYEDIPSGFAPLELHQNRDLEKQKLCSEHGIKLIVIPYWWDNRLDSLRTTLYSEVNK